MLHEYANGQEKETDLKLYLLKSKRQFQVEHAICLENLIRQVTAFIRLFKYRQ